jgi:hypothetical protein
MINAGFAEQKERVARPLNRESFKKKGDLRNETPNFNCYFSYSGGNAVLSLPAR